jgi:ATP-dependent DNA helicase RecG
LIIPFYEEIFIEKGIRVGIVSISAGISKPYVVRHGNCEYIYIRMGDRSELTTREQQARLFQAGGMPHIELLPVAGTAFRTLDLARLNSYLEHIILDPDIPSSEEQWVERLVGLGLMAEDGLGNKVCSIAGLLCFGIAPRRFIKQAGLRVMVFNSTDKKYQAALDIVLDAPLVGRWDISESSGKILADNGLIENFSELILPFVTKEPAEIDAGMRREKRWIYPLGAIREAVINALVHRDWTRTVDIEVTVYSDRMEITSPGSLQNSMTIDKMIAGQRSPRNTLIVEILRDCAYVDSRGMGVRTKIIPLMRRDNETEPIFEATEDYVKTVLPRRARDTYDY